MVAASASQALETSIGRCSSRRTKVIEQKQLDADATKEQTAKAVWEAAKAQVASAEAAIELAAAKIEEVKADIADTILKSPCGGRVEYRLVEPGEVIPAGGKVVTLLDITDVYMTFFLPTDQAGKVAIGADARIVLDALPGLPIPAKVSFVSPTAQFTPKEVETRTEREKLMFRVKVKVDPRTAETLRRACQDRPARKGLCADRGDGGMAGNAENTGAARVAAAVAGGLAMSLPRADAAPVSPVANLTGLSHHYGKTVALEAVDLAVPSGCMVGFFGPDGVGKSTLLAIIAGVRQIQKGTVNVLGGDMARVAHRRAVCPRIAYMPQGLGRNLYATLSVFENIDFFGRLFGQSRSERASRIAELLDSTGLAPFAGRPAGKLSGGMKQKLGLCCALIHDPDLLILDEPTTGVDPLSRRQFWQLIDRIRARRSGMSVLVSTAYMDEAERFDWLVGMDAGKLLAVGTADEIKAKAGTSSLEAAFIALLPEEKRRGHHAVTVPPRLARTGDGVAIEAQGLTKKFGDFTAVDHVSFRIERGEIFGFLGSNGCGKTTTMKMMTGLLPATEGKAWLFGHEVDAHDIETRKRVGFMSQAFSLYTELTVRQNLDLHAVQVTTSTPFTLILLIRLFP